MIAYVYLWAREADEGRDEGTKERPVVVVLAARTGPAGAEVIVAPVTTRPPRSGDAAVEMPAAVRSHLGLGDERCWIVAEELNRFLWPGPDLRPARRGGDTSPYYGKIPARLLEQVREAIRRTGAARLRITGAATEAVARGRSLARGRPWTSAPAARRGEGGEGGGGEGQLPGLVLDEKVELDRERGGVRRGRAEEAEQCAIEAGVDAVEQDIGGPLRRGDRRLGAAEAAERRAPAFGAAPPLRASRTRSGIHLPSRPPSGFPLSR